MRKYPSYMLILTIISVLYSKNCLAAASDENTIVFNRTSGPFQPKPYVFPDDSSDSSSYGNVAEKIYAKDYTALTSFDILDLLAAARSNNNYAQNALTNIRTNYWKTIHDKNIVTPILNELTPRQLELLTQSANNGKFTQQPPVILGEIVYITQSDTLPSSIAANTVEGLRLALDAAIAYHSRHSFAYDVPQHNVSEASSSSDNSTFEFQHSSTPSAFTSAGYTTIHEQEEPLTASDLERYWAARASLKEEYEDTSLSAERIHSSLNPEKIINLLTDALLGDQVAIKLIKDINTDYWQHNTTRLIQFLISIAQLGHKLDDLVSKAKAGELKDIGQINLGKIVGLTTLSTDLAPHYKYTMDKLKATIYYALRYNLLHNETYNLFSNDISYKNALETLRRELAKYEAEHPAIDFDSSDSDNSDFDDSESNSDDSDSDEMSEQLINLYTDMLMGKPGSDTALHMLTRSLLMEDDQGEVMLSAFKDLNASNVATFSTQYFSQPIKKLPSEVLAELIYIMENSSLDTLSYQYAKRFIYTAVKQNLLHNSIFKNFSDKGLYANTLSMINGTINMINSDLKRYNHDIAEPFASQHNADSSSYSDDDE